MRKIKFRGKSLETGEWLYGDLETDYYSNRFWIAPIYRNAELVDPDSVGQFTGKHDKNGNEIYKGDIIRLQEGHIQYYTVEWHEKNSCWIFRYNANPKEYYSFENIETFFGRLNGIKKVEIIGNTTDNPELIPND